MRKIMCVLLAGLLVMGFAGASLAAEKKAAEPSAKKAKPAEPVTITGKVVAVGKDSKGNVNAVAIRTDQGDYRVVMKDKGKDLLKLVDKKVEVEGKASEVKGKKRITVSEFKEVP